VILSLWAPSIPAHREADVFRRAEGSRPSAGTPARCVCCCPFNAWSCLYWGILPKADAALLHRHQFPLMKEFTSTSSRASASTTACSSKFTATWCAFPTAARAYANTSATRGPWRSCRSSTTAACCSSASSATPSPRVHRAAGGKLEPGEPHLDTAKRELLGGDRLQRGGVDSARTIHPPSPIPTRRSSCSSLRS